MGIAATDPRTIAAAGAVAPAAPTPALTSPLGELACRVLDVAIAGVALVLLSPLLALIALAIRLESPGPAIFRQRRLGRSLEPFMVNKFRTMQQGASDEVHRRYVLGLIAGDIPPAPVTGTGPRFKLHRDTRITRVGRFLRRTSLDELPQLWNVVRGEMSLVGPRPPIPYEVEAYQQGWFGRFAVKPGVTGLWQVSGRCELTIPEMIELDLEYVRRRSFWLNVAILVRTVPAVLSLRGAS
jgi:lipopolysaccharide/colanic/teichoic acid biosynthesis glycosyltransferase